MTTEPKRGDALQFIFSLFVGVLLVVVVGVGVWTFYPPPSSENNPKQQEIMKLQQEQEQGYNFKDTSQLTAAEKAAAEARQKRINELQNEINSEHKVWAVTTSIIVISIATILMAVSLFLPDTAKVFSNGILLGGLFTVLYGTGVSFTGGNSWARFWVVLAALVLSLGIGYLRFMRSRQALALQAAATEGAAQPAASSDLESRVASLEARLAALRSALGRD